LEIHPDYLQDASGFRGFAERLFVPASEEDLVEVVREAVRSSTPLTIAGGGTGVTGGRVARGGWVVSLEKLNRLEIRAGSALAGAGVPLAGLHAAAERSGQFYPPDPTETSAFLGGTIATNASGSRSFRYGDTRRHVLALRVVLADGRVLAVRRGEPVDFPIPALPLPRTTKHSAGFHLAPGMDWIDLFAGSEGTLGVITEAEVRLLPAPKELLAGVVFFSNDAGALEAVDAWRSCAGLRMIEYFDAGSLALLRERFPDTPAGARAALLIEQELASPDDAEMDRWPDRLEECGALADDSWFAAGAADRERFRHFRHALPESVNRGAGRELARGGVGPERGAIRDKPRRVGD
jgi:FAD/FMN-containing dehydrogenase